MNSVFADTSFYVALFNRRDRLHELAVSLSSQIGMKIVVSEFILLELGNALHQPRVRDKLVKLIDQLRNDPDVVVEPSSEELFDKALILFEARPDKEWSLIDCSSFVIMQERGLELALTADHHFEQAGFTILLK